MSRIGEGPVCPVEGHGRTYIMRDGRSWCAHQTHDDNPAEAWVDGAAPTVAAATKEHDQGDKKREARHRRYLARRARLAAKRQGEQE